MTYYVRLLLTGLFSLTIGLGTVSAEPQIGVSEEEAREEREAAYAELTPPAPQPAPPAYGAPLSPDEAMRAAEVQARMAEREARQAEREAIRAERLRVKEEARKSGKSLLVTGGSLLGAGWGASALLGGIFLDAGADSEAAYLFIPYAGGPLYLAEVLNRMDGGGPSFMVSMAFLAPTFLQVAGTALLTTGAVKRSRYNKEIARAATSLSPYVTPDASGIAFTTSF